MYLGEKSAPDWLDIRNLGGGDESLELLGLYCEQKNQYTNVFVIACNGCC